METQENNYKWWQDCIFYQIYPRSFQDTNGDGYGDIPGIILHLDDLVKLGVGAIWLSPVYQSPDADNGYDISDYKDINPIYGTLQDMDNLIAEAKARGIRIIMDLVVNHTSDEHPWFQASRRGDPKYKDYYIWKPSNNDDKSNGDKPNDDKSNDDKPNNWTGFFMGSVWEWDELRGEYYLHLFDKKQPDLNYHNPAVIEEVKDILRFWLDRGIAGFRCDVINLLWKSTFADGKKAVAIQGLEHYKSQDGMHEVLKELRRDVLEPYGAFTVGEAAMVTLDEAKDLSDVSRKELDLIFYFDHLEVDRRIARYVPKIFKAKELLAVLTKWQDHLDWNAVYLENHDQSRIVSHYGDDKKYWKESAKMLATLLLTLKGTPFIYQGQEIGMTNFDFESLNEVNDVESHKIYELATKMRVPKILRWKWIAQASRDNARTPMQWSHDIIVKSADGDIKKDIVNKAGFTTGMPWLGINHNYNDINYELEESDPDSVLHYYRALIALRAESDTLRFGEFKAVFADDDVMIYRRYFKEDDADREKGRHDSVYTVLLNFSGRKKTLFKHVFADDLIEAEFGTLLMGNYGDYGNLDDNRDDGNGSDNPLEFSLLRPWEARIYKGVR
ncbi:MAG: alpha-glucosidase [Clostridiales Family XIII bacterium]|jgi:oligo-1,6-glucosidase|nr:alpha-glucosidase [Clostridiales Family XIII bacterium]